MSSVKLTSSDGTTFDVSAEAVKASTMICDLLEACGDSATVIPLPNVTAPTLKKVIEFCEFHKDDPEEEKKEEEEQKEKRTDDLSEWDLKFVNAVEYSTLFDLVQAANYLDIKKLLDVTCKTVANMMKGKTTEVLRQQFGIESDFSPEEEEQIKRENAWCED
ncbi:hypothetical protein PRIPAC_80560 [Pristionchus pacificus]|uniref:Skp1-related protein n=1 Tax=Pristionchus pacificus TaxID=54126 RepID=A0A454XR19_PRIPA|nr:hypothetical protein PRIPAC_80560 [Pristionchus pacificus]|eukprot:PDM72130.1 hypothetical protein PRIPAC_38564 [Pristionchus pacificus]